MNSTIVKTAIFAAIVAFVASAYIALLTPHAAAQSAGYNLSTNTYLMPQIAKPAFRTQQRNTLQGPSTLQPGYFNSYGNQFTGTGTATGHNWQQDSYGNWQGTGSQNLLRSCNLDAYGRYVCN